MKNFIGTENGHEWVDLGLPTGTKWATCNIGATKPEEIGDHFAWGEVKPKEGYSFLNYKYNSHETFKLTRYNTDHSEGENGFVDGKTTLNLEDDAAYVNWGGKWMMPTMVQQMELRNECYWEWTEDYNGSGVAGFIVYKAKAEADKGVIYKDETPSSSYSLGDAHIFLPAAGECSFNGDLDYAGSDGYYWSSSLNAGRPQNAWIVIFKSDDASNYKGGFRDHGYSVRAVIPGE
ncbi:MAG: DUF1566 domain-containing protein [Bacteroidales bacterium]|nr:DUF1566 domain-containing protein [Bacteroidales bacterium]